jgi:uncharacterized protein (TIGR04552 family)
LIRRESDILRLDLRRPDIQNPRLSLADVEAVRLVLRGGSPIDWHRLNFETLSAVDDFLRTNLLDPDDPRDMARLEYLHRESIRYLKASFGYRFPVEVSHPADVRHLFLYASEQARLNRVQILSCVVLKTIHTLNHLEARSLLQESAISEAELLQVVEEQVLRRAHALTAEGLPIVHFFGSRKTRDSMINKLLSKTAARAADILDRVRFRVVVETKEDVVPVLAHLFARAFPWNQITSGQSTNNLVDVRRYLNQHRRLRHLLAGLQVDVGHEDRDAELDNEFSGSSYRMINFIIDVPVRLDHLLERAGDPWLLQHGSIVYVSCEFQVVDQETAYLNEQGDNSHANYKQRQRDRVSDRLMWGLLREGKTKKVRKGVARRDREASPLELAMTDSHPPGSIAARRRSPRPPRPELPPMPLASDKPTHPGLTPAPTLPNGFRSGEDSVVESLGASEEVTVTGEVTAAGEVTLGGEAPPVGEVTTPSRLPE